MIGLFVAWSAPAWAADVGLGANLLGMGGVGAAASRDNAAIALNPGLIGIHPRYDFQARFDYGPTGGLHWGGSAMDGRTSKRVSVGIAYSGDHTDPELAESELPGWAESGVEVTNVKRLHDFAGAVAMPMLERKLSVGLVANVGLFNNDRQGEGWTFDMGAGVGFRPIEALTFGVGARNLLSVTEDDRPPAVRAGVRAEAEDIVAVEVNVEQTFLPEDLRPDFPLWLGAGVEKPFERARFRAGWQLDPEVGEKGMNYGTLGIGYVDEAGSLEYGVMIPLEDTSLAGTVHGFQIRFGAPAEIPPE